MICGADSLVRHVVRPRVLGLLGREGEFIVKRSSPVSGLAKVAGIEGVDGIIRSRRISPIERGTRRLGCEGARRFRKVAQPVALFVLVSVSSETAKESAPRRMARRCLTVEGTRLIVDWRGWTVRAGPGNVARRAATVSRGVERVFSRGCGAKRARVVVALVVAMMGEMHDGVAGPGRRSSLGWFSR